MSRHKLDLQRLATLKAASLHPEAEQKAQERLDNLTKPPGSLGVMESIVKQLAAISGEVCPSVDPAVVLLFAGDHGITEEGVSPYPDSRSWPTCHPVAQDPEATQL